MIKYSIQYKVIEGNGEIRWKDVDSELFNTCVLAETDAKQRILARKKQLEAMTESKRRGWVQSIDYKIIEVTVEDKIVIEGNVSDNGCDYEDYMLVVGEEHIDGVIGHKFMGENIRVTIERIVK